MEQSLFTRIALHASVPLVTRILIFLNMLVFVLMLLGGAGFWHSPNTVQLVWGANFAPATADGQWWRLGSAMFLHFGALHLGMNMLALWDGGKLVERMFGAYRFLVIYLISGVVGNLLSLVIQGNDAVSGGASGAVFGIYGALMVYVWFARHQMQQVEFRWLFLGALAFSALTIAMGYIVPGIDNSAHIGGFATGIVVAVMLLPATVTSHQALRHELHWVQWIAGAAWVIATFWMLAHLPTPKYRWQQELAIQKQVQKLSLVDQQAQRKWQRIVLEGQEGNVSFDDMASQIDAQVATPYEESFEKLSSLSDDPKLPSAALLEQAKAYALKRSEASKAAAERLRNIPFMPEKPGS
ncbi:rhomboid family intramembrane serine protease [Methylophilus aquaticus]|uniref:Rhomboid family intramembrane serine protease n=1 Tax=Methylophilus aquaticus TaxID=1971610 RepID=A0ABT9JQ23_9PROT|nr:rhomboid family intramembrane serine protease [Methylophilus aquaticus]MDP8566657.1 rhomboid family intramembrane serine protease [Methylophilus aquaticus]